MAQQSKADSFSAYLESAQRSKANPPSGAGTSMDLLNALDAADQKQKKVTDLMAASAMSITDFADALRNLQQSGYLTLSGQGESEIAKLTALGQDVARLARR